MAVAPGDIGEGPPESRTEPRDGDGFGSTPTGPEPATPNGGEHFTPIPEPTYTDPFGYHDGSHEGTPANGSTAPAASSPADTKTTTPTQTLGDLLSSLFGGSPQQQQPGGTVSTQVGGSSKAVPVMLLLIGVGLIGYYVYQRYYGKKKEAQPTS